MTSGVARILVATDRSETADRAVKFAADMAGRYEADLLLLQVIVPEGGLDGRPGSAERTQLTYAEQGLRMYAEELAGERGHAVVVVDDDPAAAIVEAAAREEVDVVVVGNAGMSGRKEFLLGNVPNRVSHNASCTVVIVNSTLAPEEPKRLGRFFGRS
jgi:nucleotide-binding universal stress UspA family protein